jgi:hypothetical protein
MSSAETRWVSRLRAAPGGTIEELLAVPRGLDVWQRDGDTLVVAAGEGVLAELERRALATVERICTVAEYEQRYR